MSIDKDATQKRLSELWQARPEDALTTLNKRYVIISDTHMGDGSDADDFRDNRETLAAALDYYNANAYDLILLGDIEEFWQFDLEKISARYGDTIYARMRAFAEDRIHRVFGNHDREWGGLPDPTKNGAGIRAAAVEAIKMKDKEGNARILLVHGHQGSIDADKNSWMSRFFVRIFKQLEPAAKWLHLYGHSSATKSQVTEDYEQTFYGWAKKNKVLLICGHSHRAISASRSYAAKLFEKIGDLQKQLKTKPPNAKAIKDELDKTAEEWRQERLKGRNIDPTRGDTRPVPCYFNSGCALYTDGMTCIEIENDEIRLIKWDRFAGREDFGACTLTKSLEEISAS